MDVPGVCTHTSLQTCVPIKNYVCRCIYVLAFVTTVSCNKLQTDSKSQTSSQFMGFFFLLHRNIYKGIYFIFGLVTSELLLVLLKRSQYSDSYVTLIPVLEVPVLLTSSHLSINHSLSHVNLMLSCADLMSQCRLTKYAQLKNQQTNCGEGLFSNGLTFESQFLL